MAKLWTLGTLWWITVLGWLLSPILTLLVNKLFAYLSDLVFDASRKLWELQFHTMSELKQTLQVVEEKRILKAVKDMECQFDDLKTLDKMNKDIKSALYEAEDILDLVDYYRIRKDLGSSWVQDILRAACKCIARCKFRQWIKVTQVVLVKCAQRFHHLLGRFIIHLNQQLGQFIVHLNQQLQQFIIHLIQQLGQLFKSVNLHSSGALLPVFSVPSTSVADAANPPLGQDAQKKVREAVKEVEGEDEENMKEKEEEEKEEEREAEEVEEEDEDKVQEIEEEEKDEEREALEEVEEDNKEEREEEQKEQREVLEWERWSRWAGKLHYHRIWHCIRSITIWLINAFATVCYYRDWSYGPIILENVQMDYSFLSIILRINLRKRIEHIEYILDVSKQSHLLNQQSSSSSESPVKDSNNKEICGRQGKIDDLLRSIERKVFGRDKERGRICRMLRKERDACGPSSNTIKNYSVIGIHGITGSGKSTLAQYVCDYEERIDDGKYFDLVMFIHVPKTFTVDDIFRDMLEKIKPYRSSNAEDQKNKYTKDLKSLEKELKGKLRGQRFLLVLDDVWVSDENQDDRDILLDALNVGRCGSKILVTAQTKYAAAALGAQEQISIPDLEEEEYLSLFMHHALQGAVDVDGQYKRIGSKIAKKLHRSPIAAVTVARRLQSNRSIGFWETIANLDMLSKTMGALWWSYRQLGADIGRCFAYCSTFPRGYKLKRDELVRIWIAQGFVSTRGNATEELEDVGNRYFDELQTFSFLQVQRTIFDTEVFTIHDLLHELAERIARSDFHRIDLNGSPKDIPAGVRHVFIETNNVAKVVVEKSLDLGKLRTLIIKERCTYEDREQPMDDLKEVFDCLFMTLGALRVLIVELQHKLEVLSLPASVDQMKHLRYLGFNHYATKLILPSTFRKLYHMQTIDARNAMVSCPEDMANLIDLRYFSAWQPFPNVGRMTSLRTLPRFKIEEEQGYELKQLEHLNKLRGTLEISGLGIVGSKEEALEAHLARKEQVTELVLDFGYNTCNPDVAAEVIEGLCPPKDLLELNIHDYKGSRYPSWMLSRQHPDAPKRLQKLSVRYCCSRLASIPKDSELFTHLRELRIELCDWDRLPENMERLVSLQNLVICGCHNMELLPTLPRSLREIQIIYCHVLCATCEEEGHENWHKIQHIPKKAIGP